ncbi:hypothetical protein J6590_074252, partial [Homalodisca vitripennis]
MYGGALPFYDLSTTTPYRVVHLEQCGAVCFNCVRELNLQSHENVWGAVPLHDLSTTAPYRVVHLER